MFSLAVIVAIGNLDVQAQSPQNLPPVNLGFTSFMDGAPPAGPGLYWSQYLQYYTADQINGATGAPLPLPDPSLNAWASLTQFIYLWEEDVPFLSAKPALDVLIPAASIDLDFAAPVPITASNGGLGDLLIGPALQFNPIMGEQGPVFLHRFEAQFIIPTGQYDRANVINAGSNFFSFNPYWAGTVFLPEKFNASFRAHYLWNATNDEPAAILGPGVTETRAGEAFHINFTLDREIVEKMLRVGVNGYWLTQTTDAEVNGVEVPNSRERVLGIGPGALLSFSQTQHVFFNFFWETDAVNRPDGFRMTLRYVHRF